MRTKWIYAGVEDRVEKPDDDQGAQAAQQNLPTGLAAPDGGVDDESHAHAEHEGEDRDEAGRHEEVQGVGGRRDHGVDQDGAVTPQMHNVGGIDQENARNGETAQGVEEMESDGGGGGAHGVDRRRRRRRSHRSGPIFHPGLQGRGSVATRGWQRRVRPARGRVTRWAGGLFAEMCTSHSRVQF